MGTINRAPRVGVINLLEPASFALFGVGAPLFFSDIGQGAEMTHRRLEQKDFLKRLEKLRNKAEGLEVREIERNDDIIQALLVLTLENHVSITLFSEHLACIHSLISQAKKADVVFPIYLAMCVPKDQRMGLKQAKLIESVATNLVYSSLTGFIKQGYVTAENFETHTKILKELSLLFSRALRIMECDLHARLIPFLDSVPKDKSVSSQVEVLDKIKNLFTAEDISDIIEKTKKSCQTESSRILGSGKGGRNKKLTARSHQIGEATRYLTSINWITPAKEVEQYNIWRSEQGLKTLSTTTAREHLKKAKDIHKKTK
ncbi:hypothetical protein [Parasutterella sp.]|uniref:hypothetical protein n=1 Tax=Parasutterella sp. TaxID=2049037 RepID=UPI0025DD26D5|nr:hypothetical protein [Parasutterella sp.]